MPAKSLLNFEDFILKKKSLIFQKILHFLSQKMALQIEN